ncbi:MAG: hypothetical protein KDD25_00705, partial [Bdellovibrionales bacterium]|nr:hypothetical protein [Bdellovibrionales bacterium]
MKNALIISFYVLFSSTLLNAQDFNRIPSAVPLARDLEPARDLIYQGREITPSEALRLVKEGKVRDLTDLDPKESDIWKNGPIAPISKEGFSLGFRTDGEQAQYRGTVVSPFNIFRFEADFRDSSGRPVTNIVSVGPQIHNTLLRKGLLEKIGYRVPNMQYLRNLRLQFSDQNKKQLFLNSLFAATSIEPQRWIRDNVGDTDTTLTIKDALVSLSPVPFFDLSGGRVPASEIQGRRILNSAIVPFAITELTENVNASRWHVGQIANNQIIFPIPDGSAFSTTFEDARWILKRIGKLTRKDWDEVVEQAHFPPAVGGLFTEILISRRNQLRVPFELEKTIDKIKYDDHYSYGSEVVKGRLVKTDYPDWGAKFFEEDPKPRLSGYEMKNLFKSKVISNILGNMVSNFNSEIVPSTNIGKELFLHQIDLAARQYADYIGTGEVKEIPFGFWTTPYYNGNLIAARDVVAGSYLGTDNLVQLADTFGYSVGTGIFANADGLPSGYSLTGRAELFLTTTFTHVKPISSIKLAVEEPYRNIVVPLLMDGYGKIFDQLSSPDFSNLSEEDQNKAMSEMVKLFKDKLGIGESLIVSWTWGGRFDVGVGYGFTDRVRAQAGFNAAKRKFSRIHILR